MPIPNAPARLTAWAEATRTHEGWFKGSRSWRNNTPGNLKMTEYVRSLGATGADLGGFAIFPSADRGFAGLMQFLRDAAEGKLRPSKGDPTLREFYGRPRIGPTPTPTPKTSQTRSAWA